MTIQNERRHPPRNTVAKDIEGEFHITVEGKSYPIHKVKDVSISGIGVVLPRRVHKDTNVRLIFKADDLGLELEGRIVWCADNSAPSSPDTPPLDVCQVGIEFSAANGDDNCLLFMALRKYLDDFE